MNPDPCTERLQHKDSPDGPLAGASRRRARETPGAILARKTFSVSRLAEFASESELVKQTGHPVDRWPLVIVKELVDNGLDACEEAGIAPEIAVTIDDGVITVADNGPGMPAETVEKLVDYSVRTSSRAAYVSPTRGAQGNALPSLIAMPFVLGDDGAFVVETHGIARRVAFSIDPIRQIPKVELIESPSPIVGQNRRRRGANFYNLPPPTPGSTRISNSAWSGAAPATK